MKTLPDGDVELRDVAEEDLPIFFEHQMDPEATRMAAFPSRDMDAFMAHWKKILADATLTAKTILFDGRVAGNVVCFEQGGERQVGYWIGREYWGKRIATRALEALLKVVTIRPLYAHVAKHNLGSIRVLEKCGFVVVRTSSIDPGAGEGDVEELVMRLGAER